MNKIALNISNLLAEYRFINKKDIPICAYGIEFFLIFVLEFGAVLFISLLIGNFFETVIFLASFVSIRIFAGGYHANTKLRCFFVLLGVYTIFSIILRYDNFEIYKYPMIIIPFVNIFFILLLSPLKHKNKKLSIIERKKFKKISFVLSLMQGFIILLLSIFNVYNKYSIALFMGALTVLVSLISGSIKNYIQQNLKVRC